MKYISPSQTIQKGIADSINSTFEILLEPKQISLDICYPKYGSHYTSAIALAIASRLGIDALKIAELIAQTYAQNLALTSKSQIKAFGKGWLNICLSEKYLAENLFALESFLHLEGDAYWQNSNISIVNSAKEPEPVLQYVYARCCALIRLAHSHLELMEAELHSTPIILVGIESVEISLFMQQLAIADYLESKNSLALGNPKLRLKLSRSLAEVFLQFYDRCRIFGVPRELAVRRWLLIRITQKLLSAIAPHDINYAMYL